MYDESEARALLRIVSRICSRSPCLEMSVQDKYIVVQLMDTIYV